MDPNPYESPKYPTVVAATVASPWVRLPLAVVCILIVLIHILALVAWTAGPARDEMTVVLAIAVVVTCALGAAGFGLISFGLLANRARANIAGLVMIAVEMLIQFGYAYV
jgi:hypothetical protein